MVSRVGDPVACADERHAERSVERHVALHEPIELLAASAPNRRCSVGGAKHVVKKRLRDEAGPLGRSAHRLPLVDLANDGEDAGARKRKRYRRHDGEPKHKPRLPAFEADARGNLETLAAIPEHQGS